MSSVERHYLTKSSVNFASINATNSSLTIMFS